MYKLNYFLSLVINYFLKYLSLQNPLTTNVFSIIDPLNLRL